MISSLKTDCEIGRRGNENVYIKFLKNALKLMHENVRK